MSAHDRRLAPSSGRAGGGRLPSFIIIGAQKCATTSLYFHLHSHPDIRMAGEKELNFFVAELNWSRGVEWYASQFDGAGKVAGEASPNYTAVPRYRGVAERMARLTPEIKLIYIVRDPVERMISQYVHYCASGLESRSFVEALTPTDWRNPYISRSLYQMQIEQYLRCFPREQIFIISLEQMRSGPEAVLKDLFLFLDVSPDLKRATFPTITNASHRKRRRTVLGEGVWTGGMGRLLERVPWKYRGPLAHIILLPLSRRVPRPSISPNMRERLVDCLREDIHSFRRTAGQDFAEWSI